MPKAVIYCRVSSAEQVEGTSLTTQEDACRAWCSKNGLFVERVYIDAGESAKSADRPQFLKMISDCAKIKDLNKVVVYRLDRFARNTLDHAIYAQRIKHSGALLVSVSEPIPDDPGGRMMESVYAAIAQFDNDVRSARAKDAMRAVQAKGGWTHKAPWGFRIVRRDGLPFLTPDEAILPIIQKAYALLLSGKNPQTIFEQLRPSTSRTTFYNVFRNPIYFQIDPDRFPIVQNAMGYARPRSDRSEDFPLRGLLICAECHTPLTASMAKGKYPFYHCRKPGHASIKLSAVDAAIREILSDISGPIQLAMPALKAAVAIKAKAAAAHALAESDSHASTVSLLEARMARLHDALLDGRITGPAFDRLRIEIESALQNARAALASSKRSEASELDLLIQAESVLVDLASLWNRVTPASRLRLVRNMFPDGIIVAKNTVRTSASDSIFRTLCFSDTGLFRMAPPTGYFSNLTECLKTLSEIAA